MGLDTYASRNPDDIVLTDEDMAAFEQAAIQLCGGLLSGDDASFRGKVYVDVVERVADASLLADWTPPEAVRGIADAFDRCDPVRVADASRDDHYPIVESEVVELRRFFRLCADRGLGLIGSW